MVYPLETTPENVPANYQWRFQVLEGEHADLELNRLPGIPPNGRVMVVKGSMSFDENGQVDSLFLDSPSSMGALRPQIIRSLRRIRRLGPKRSSHIRFRFDYAPVEDSR
jgi:hypothetical protein